MLVSLSVCQSLGPILPDSFQDHRFKENQQRFGRTQLFDNTFDEVSACLIIDFQVCAYMHFSYEAMICRLYSAMKFIDKQKRSTLDSAITKSLSTGSFAFSFYCHLIQFLCWLKHFKRKHTISVDYFHCENCEIMHTESESLCLFSITSSVCWLFRDIILQKARVLEWSDLKTCNVVRALSSPRNFSLEPQNRLFFRKQLQTCRLYDR
jgi:hypothetical protein